MSQEPRPTRAKRNYARWALVLLFGLTVIGGCGALVATRGPGGDGVFASADGLDGDRFHLTQVWEDWFEPYVLDLWVVTAGGEVLRSPIAFEESRWRDARFEQKMGASGPVLDLFARGRLQATVDLASRSVQQFNERGAVWRTMTMNSDIPHYAQRIALGP